MFRYKLQGLLLESDRALPTLTALGAAGKPDVEFRTGFLPGELDVEGLRRGEPAYVSPFCDSNGQALSRMWRCPTSGLYYFDFIEGFAFAVDSDGKTIWAYWPETITLQDITAFLLGRMLAFVLHLRGYVCLHASAVAVEGGAVLFAGFPGMGKSTTAAAFAERGYPILSDDVSAIRREPNGTIAVMPGVPRVCLLPDSLEFLFGAVSSERFPLLEPAGSKRLVRLDGSPGKFQTDPRPLEAIYLLEPRSDDASAPRIEAVAGADRLIRLLYNGFMNLALDKEQAAREFQMLGEIARSIRIRQLVPSSDPRKLDRLCELVVNDVRASNVSIAGPSAETLGCLER